MSQSELAIVRKEMVALALENTNFKKEITRLKETNARRQDEIINLKASESALKNKLALAMKENAMLERVNEDCLRRLAKYENSATPSSADSIYNSDRKKFEAELQREAEEGEEDGDATTSPKDGPGDADEGGKNAEKAGGPESDCGARAPRSLGPPKGHPGTSHSNKAKKTVRLSITRCDKCGRGHLKKGPAPVVKLVSDFTGPYCGQMTTVAYVCERGWCKRCNHTSTAPAPTLAGTSLGPRALGVIFEYYFKRSTDKTTAYYFGSLYGFGMSENMVWNARMAISRLLRGTYIEIQDHISMADFAGFDEAVMRMNGKKGYIWLVTTPDATYVVAAPSREAIILELYFQKMLHLPSVTDGYVAYDILPIRQRCWVHILLKAKEYGIKEMKKERINPGTTDGRYKLLYKKLLNLYDTIKNRTSASTAECLHLQKTVCEIAHEYPEDHKFRTTLECASPNLFTFLRYPGLPPHNNGSELELRDTAVLHRNVRHQLCTPQGRMVFSVMISVGRTCVKNKIFPRHAVEKLFEDTGWSIFGQTHVQAAKKCAEPAATRPAATAC